jgi:hypothetical protein
MTDAVLWAGPSALRPAHFRPLGAVCPLPALESRLSAGILVVALGQQQHGPGKAAEQLCGVLRRQRGPGYWAWPGV